MPPARAFVASRVPLSVNETDPVGVPEAEVTIAVSCAVLDISTGFGTQVNAVLVGSPLIT